ncbi:MAG: hypothetical protein ACPLPR_08695 [Bacillota bacterium]
MASYAGLVPRVYASSW